jgi:hypothetical protein
VIDIAETTFLPLGTSRPGHADPPLVYVMVELYNRDEVAHRFRAIGSATLRGSTTADIRARFDENACALVAHNDGRPEWVRVFGLSEKPTKYGSDFELVRWF